MDYRKVGASLAEVWEEFQRSGAAGLAPYARHLGVVSLGQSPKPPRLLVFVECAEGASLDHLAAIGLEMNQNQGRLRTGIVSIEGLDALSEDPAVVRVVPGRHLQLLLDIAVPKVGITTFRQTCSLSGRGVVIGIVDSGVQGSHPSFAGRLLRLWDQTVPGMGVAEGGYGVELTGDNFGLSADIVGHGTHLCAVAAGSDPNYEGVAPGAELVVVKTDMLTTHVADGIRYVFRVARELGRRAVVNLSMGGHDDPHDGTDPLSAVVNVESGPGRVVCCAAGNDGSDNVHAQVAVAAGRLAIIACSLPVAAAGQARPPAVFTGWYSGADEVEVAVAGPSGDTTPFQPALTAGSPVRSYHLADGVVNITTPGPDPGNGDKNFVVRLESPTVSAPSQPALWQIRLRGTTTGTGRVDVWIVDSQTAQFSGDAVADSVKIGAPAAASRAISVGAYTTRSDWDDVLGNPHQSGLVVDDIAPFSSAGPRRDGVAKPDLSAPGAMVVSALSDHEPPPLDVVIDAVNTIMAGTSVASSFVAGLVALLLEADAHLGPEAVKTLLQGHSSIAGRPRGTYDPKWGYGLVDASGLIVPHDGRRQD